MSAYEISPSVKAKLSQEYQRIFESSSESMARIPSYLFDTPQEAKPPHLGTPAKRVSRTFNSLFSAIDNMHLGIDADYINTSSPRRTSAWASTQEKSLKLTNVTEIESEFVKYSACPSGISDINIMREDDIESEQSFQNLALVSTDILPNLKLDTNQRSFSQASLPIPDSIPQSTLSVQTAQWPKEYINIVDSPEFDFSCLNSPAPYHPETRVKFNIPSWERPPRLVYTADYKSKKKHTVYNDALAFESRFESGNLLDASQVAEHEYHLRINPDYHTKGHCQWYFFQIKNMKKGIVYQFKITNLTKKNALYGKGMQPLFYSQKSQTDKKIGWIRAGSSVQYGPNMNEDAEKRAHTISFFLEFQYDNDTAYLAHCYPFTYTQLQKYVLSACSDIQNQDFLRHKVIGKTCLGNNIDMFTITKRAADPTELSHRKTIVLTARVHPGETNSSWIMHGFLLFLLSADPKAAYLRSRFIFKIVPMLNPDGVIVGNYRCNINGFDLNRAWNLDESFQDQVSEIWQVKNMISECALARPIAFFCDFHGHKYYLIT